MVIASVIALFVFSVSLVPLGFVKSVFFPIQDSDYVFVDIRTPVGTSLAETDKRTSEIENALLDYKDIANMATIIGQPSANSGTFGAGSGSSNLSSLSLTLKEANNRNLKSYELPETLRKYL